jgi:hypothetical protein
MYADLLGQKVVGYIRGVASRQASTSLVELHTRLGWELENRIFRAVGGRGNPRTTITAEREVGSELRTAREGTDDFALLDRLLLGIIGLLVRRRLLLLLVDHPRV